MHNLKTIQTPKAIKVRTKLSVDIRMLKTCLSKLHNLCYFMIAQYIYKKNFMDLFHGSGSTASSLQSHYEETVYFLPLSSQKFLVLI